MAGWNDQPTEGNKCIIFFVAHAYRVAHPHVQTSPFTHIIFLKLNTGSLNHQDMQCLLLMKSLSYLDLGQCSLSLPVNRQSALMHVLQQLPRLGAVHMKDMEGYFLTPRVFGSTLTNAFPHLYQADILATSEGAACLLNCVPKRVLNDLAWSVKPTINHTTSQCFHPRFWQVLRRQAGTSLDTLTLRFPEDGSISEARNGFARWEPDLEELTAINIYGPSTYALTSFINPLNLGNLTNVFHDHFTWDSLPQMNHMLSQHCNIRQLEFGTIEPNYALHQHLIHQQPRLTTLNLREVPLVIIHHAMVPGVDLNGRALRPSELASLLLLAFPDLEQVVFKRRQMDHLEVRLPRALAEFTGIIYNGLNATISTLR